MDLLFTLAHHPPGVHAVFQKLPDKAGAESGHHHLAGNLHGEKHRIPTKVFHQSLHAASCSQWEAPGAYINCKYIFIYINNYIFIYNI